MPSAQLEFTAKFTQGPAGRAKTLARTLGDDPHVALQGQLYTHLLASLGAAAFGSTRPAPNQQKLPTLSLSVVELVLGRMAVPVGSELAAEPFYSWHCELPTLVKLHDQLSKSGFVWPTNTTIEGLVTAIDAHMCTVQDLSPYHVKLGDTRRVEAPTPETEDTVRSQFEKTLEEVRSDAVFKWGAPLGAALSPLFHLSSRYRVRERVSGEYADSLQLLINTFTECNKGVKGMKPTWVLAQALTWFTRARIPLHLWEFGAGASGASCLRLLQFIQGSVEGRAYSFEAAFPYYLSRTTSYCSLRDLLTEADGSLTKNPQPLVVRLGDGLAGKGETVPPSSCDLLDFIEHALASREHILSDPANVGSARDKVDFILSAEQRAIGLAAAKPEEGSEGGASTPATLASMVRDLMGDSSFQKGISLISDLADSGDATLNDFVEAAFSSQCLALVKHFTGARKIPGHHEVLSHPMTMGMANCVAAEMKPISDLLLPLLFDLECGGEAGSGLPLRLIGYGIKGSFLQNLLTGSAWAPGRGFELFEEVVHRPDFAAYSTPIPPGDEDSFCTDLAALETLRRRLPAICETLFGFPADEKRGVAWVIDTAIDAVRNANRVPCCKPYLLSGVRTFLRSALDQMGAQRRSTWRAPTLVAPRPTSILSRRYFRGEDKLAADLEYAIEIGRREEMMGRGTSPPPLAFSSPPPRPCAHPPLPPVGSSVWPEIPEG